jgi:Coenzyme PQQ synthesis protein D (PqqD)
MGELALDRVVRVPDDVIFRELQGEGVLLNLGTSMYFGLDHTGTAIWRLCEAHGSLRMVLEAMQHEFQASSDTLQADLLAFVGELIENGLLAVQQHAA